MDATLKRAIAELPRLTVVQLRARYAAAHGEPTRAANKGWLVRRIAWRLQANAEGGLTDRARRRAEEIANGADLRLNPPRAAAFLPDPEPVVRTLPFAVDARLPPRAPCSLARTRAPRSGCRSWRPGSSTTARRTRPCPPWRGPSTPAARFAFDVLDGRRASVEAGTYYFWDALAAAVAIDERFSPPEAVSIRVELQPDDEGRTVADAAGRPVRVCRGADLPAFEQLFLDTISTRPRTAMG